MLGNKELRRVVQRVGPRIAAARAFSSVPAQPPTLVSTLPNQLRVASESMGGETATVGVWIDSGSRYESDATNGVANFVERLALKGAATETIENLGGQLTAYTSRETTAYYAKVLKKDVPKAVEVLSGMVTKPAFSAEAVSAEADAILAEMDAEGMTEEVIFDMLHEAAFIGTPLSRTVTGPMESIKAISAEDMKTYVATHYTAPRMVLAAAGAVEHDMITDLAAKHLGSVPAEPPAGLTYDDAASLFSGADLRDFNDDMSTAHFALSFEGLKWTDPDVFSLMLCTSLLGTYDATAAGQALTMSKLASDVAKLGAGVKTMTPFCTSYTDTGLFGVYVEMAMAKKEHVDDTLGTIQEELVALTTGVDDASLAAAKAQLKYKMLTAVDGTTATAEEIGKQMLVYGRRMPLAETFARIDMIEADDVTRVADKVIWDQEVSFAAMGPNLKYAFDINGLRRGTYWNRM